jgi:hypothetical protein
VASSGSGLSPGPHDPEHVKLDPLAIHHADSYICLGAEYPITMIVSPSSSFLKNRLTILAADVGSYSYGLGHPMKPLRMRITHELLTAYDMLDKMDVLVSIPFLPTSLLECSAREQSVQLLKP